MAHKGGKIGYRKNHHAKRIIRSPSESDTANVLSLINLIQPHIPFSKARYSWVGRECPHGKSLQLVCKVQDDVVGYICQVPYKWFVMGRDRVGSMFIDVMTHPDHRLQGIHNSMSQRSMSHSSESGSSFSYVFPNQKSVKQIENFNWYKVLRLPLFTRKVHRNEKPFYKPTNSDFKEILRFDHRFNDFIELFRDIFPFMLKRDARYLNWRYVDHPDEKYRIFLYAEKDVLLGYMVFKIYNNGVVRKAHIIDILVDPDNHELIDSFIEKAIELASNAGVNELSLWMVPRPTWRDKLEMHEFVKIETDRYLYIKNYSSAISEDYIQNDRNWYITMGDSDVF